MKLKIILLSLLVVMLACSQAAAQQPAPEEQGSFAFASLVKKFNDGYLVSILHPQNGMYRVQGFGKYFERFDKSFNSNIQNIPRVHNTFIIDVDLDDYSVIEEETGFNLNTSLIFFGSWNRGNSVTKGEKYYFGFDPIGQTHIEDFFVWVKGNSTLEAISPIWAKNYKTGDETYLWEQLKVVENWKYKNTDILTKMHQAALAELNTKAQKQGIKNSILDTIKEYQEEVLAVKLLPTKDFQYLVTVNGKSVIQNFRFCLGLLFDPQGNLIQDIMPADIFQDDRDYYLSTFKINHIYHSKKSGKDWIIATQDGGMGGEVMLFYEEDGEIWKITLDSWHGC